MKTTLIIEGSMDVAGGDTLLLNLVMMLGQHGLCPESLVWTVLGEKREVRVWLVLNGEKSAVGAFAEDCRSLAGVRYLTEDPVEERARVLSRIRELELRSPILAPPVPAFRGEPPVVKEPPCIVLPPDVEFVD